MRDILLAIIQNSAYWRSKSSTYLKSNGTFVTIDLGVSRMQAEIQQNSPGLFIRLRAIAGDRLREIHNPINPLLQSPTHPLLLDLYLAFSRAGTWDHVLDSSEFRAILADWAKGFEANPCFAEIERYFASYFQRTSSHSNHAVGEEKHDKTLELKSDDRQASVILQQNYNPKDMLLRLLQMHLQAPLDVHLHAMATQDLLIYMESKMLSEHIPASMQQRYQYILTAFLTYHPNYIASLSQTTRAQLPLWGSPVIRFIQSKPSQLSDESFKQLFSPLQRKLQAAQLIGRNVLNFNDFDTMSLFYDDLNAEQKLRAEQDLIRMIIWDFHPRHLVALERIISKMENSPNVSKLERGLNSLDMECLTDILWNASIQWGGGQFTHVLKYFLILLNRRSLTKLIDYLAEDLGQKDRYGEQANQTLIGIFKYLPLQLQNRVFQLLHDALIKHQYAFSIADFPQAQEPSFYVMYLENGNFNALSQNFIENALYLFKNNPSDPYLLKTQKTILDYVVANKISLDKNVKELFGLWSEEEKMDFIKSKFSFSPTTLRNQTSKDITYFYDVIFFIADLLSPENKSQLTQLLCATQTSDVLDELILEVNNSNPDFMINIDGHSFFPLLQHTPVDKRPSKEKMLEMLNKIASYRWYEILHCNTFASLAASIIPFYKPQLSSAEHELLFTRLMAIIKKSTNNSYAWHALAQLDIGDRENEIVALLAGQFNHYMNRNTLELCPQFSQNSIGFILNSISATCEALGVGRNANCASQIAEIISYVESMDERAAFIYGVLGPLAKKHPNDDALNFAFIRAHSDLVEQQAMRALVSDRVHDNPSSVVMGYLAKGSAHR